MIGVIPRADLHKRCTSKISHCLKVEFQLHIGFSYNLKAIDKESLSFISSIRSNEDEYEWLEDKRLLYPRVRSASTGMR